MKLAIKIFTPEEMAKLLAHAEGDLVVTLCLQAFAGLRVEEVKRLGWEHIDLHEGHIVVPDTIAKTEERRLPPIPDNLALWLKAHVKSSGPVCPYNNMANVYAHLAKRAGVNWKRNGLRHSFISYRVAQTKNVPQVSLEAGNSPQMIHRHYLKLVTETIARQWFAIVPDNPSNVIPVPLSQGNIQAPAAEAV
jgi:integrase